MIDEFDPLLLALKMEQGATSQGMQADCGSGKSKERISPLEMLHSFAKAAIMKAHRLGGLHNRCSFAHSSKG